MEIALIQLIDGSVKAQYKGLDHVKRTKEILFCENQNDIKKNIIIEELLKEFSVIQKYREGNLRHTFYDSQKITAVEDLKLRIVQLNDYASAKKFDWFLNYSEKVILPLLDKINPPLQSHLFLSYQKRIEAIKNVINFAKTLLNK